MKAVDLVVKSTLPEDMQDLMNEYDAKDINHFLLELSRKHPDKYTEVSHKLAQEGLKSSYMSGESILLDDLLPVIDKDAIMAQMDEEVEDVREEFRNDPEQFKKEREKIWLRYSDLIQDQTMQKAREKHNAIGIGVSSGARGKPGQLKSMLSTPALYQDQSDRIIPVFVRNSFSEGLRPTEYMAGSFGARKSVTATKRATAQGGDLMKLAGQATSRLLVTTKDCGANNGIKYDLQDPVVPGRVLAKDTGGYKAGTILDRKAVSDLRRQKLGGVMARSPITCQAEEGVCSKCTGKMLDSEGLPPVGTHVGATASQAVFEPVVQGSLSTKHLAGQASTKKTYGGFDILSQFMQSPSEYQHKAAVAEQEGRVTDVKESPSGGFDIMIGDNRHYVPQGYAPMVKVGDRVDPGEQLSEGIVDVRDVVRLKGLGAGRKYYAERLGQIFEESGMKAHPKNLELVAKGALNSVKLDEDIEGLDALPDDVISYNKILRAWKPKNVETSGLDDSLGKYLTGDTIHHTAGTPITRTVIKDLKDSGLKNVKVTRDKPPFSPHMDRIRVASHYNDDWLASMSTSYLKDQLREAATRGQTTDYKNNVHWAPRLAYGKDFGREVMETGKF